MLVPRIGTRGADGCGAQGAAGYVATDDDGIRGAEGVRRERRRRHAGSGGGCVATDDGTRLELRHEHIPNYFDAAANTKPWEQALDKLVAASE